jgi:2-oxoacid:acceptor oxidoreductase delta subunit (pyruvate/2-ketoisovalerate family)
MKDPMTKHPTDQASVIVFESEAEMPDVAMSLGTTLYNKTGSWRYLRPLYRNKTPPCNHACPSGEDIVLYLRWAKEGRYQEALQRILEENPFPGVCGRVCPHPCESECNRAELGGAIAIHAMERFLADLPVARKLPVIKPVEPAAPRVAVIGSGPAGLSCAYQLARRGYRVTVFEALSEPGGMMRVGIPSYRLPRAVLDSEIAAIEALGVEIRTGQRLGDNLSWHHLSSYPAVFLAVGQHRSHRLDVPGEDGPGVLPGLTFLRQVNAGQKVPMGSRVAVIGGGNTAMDAARSARRLGARHVSILYRRSRNEMPAIQDEIDETEAEGIHIEYLTAPVEVLRRAGRVSGLKCMRMRLGEPDERGRRRPEPIPGSEHTVKADTVITALGQEADLSGLEELGAAKGLMVINEAGATSPAKPAKSAGRSSRAEQRTFGQVVFAGGDAATGFGTVAYAIGSGKRAALAIDRLLTGQDLKGSPPLSEHVHAAPREMDPTVVHFQDLNLAYFAEEPRTPQPQRPAQERIKDMAEVNLDIATSDAQREAERCFSCGTCNGCDTCWLFCPDVAISRSDHVEYQVDYDYCKGCGVCAEECPREAISIEEELKWRK